MDPVARVVIETFLDAVFLDENTFEETLLVPARDADMDRTEAIAWIFRAKCEGASRYVLCVNATKSRVGDMLRAFV